MAVSLELVHDAASAKRALRERVRAERRRRSDAQRSAVADALAAVLLEMPEVRQASCVAIYASVGGEPGTDPARRLLRELGRLVLLPVVTPDLDLDWAVDDGHLVAVPGLGGPEPTGPRLGAHAIAAADVVVAPAMAVDTLGHRLGQGGGCYDKTLGRVDPSALVVALLHDEELLDAAVEPVPWEQHDRGVNAVVTPTRWMRLDADRTR